MTTTIAFHGFVLGHPHGTVLEDVICDMYDDLRRDIQTSHIRIIESWYGFDRFNDDGILSGDLVPKFEEGAVPVLSFLVDEYTLTRCKLINYSQYSKISNSRNHQHYYFGGRVVIWLFPLKSDQ